MDLNPNPDRSTIPWAKLIATALVSSVLTSALSIAGTAVMMKVQIETLAVKVDNLKELRLAHNSKPWHDEAGQLVTRLTATLDAHLKESEKKGDRFAADLKELKRDISRMEGR